MQTYVQTQQKQYMTLCKSHGYVDQTTIVYEKGWVL